jgi:colanic acid/amylovoran biosynthesis glycosyltransferase
MREIAMTDDRILLVLPLPLFSVNGKTFIETQACTSLGHWLDNFRNVTLMGPQIFLSEPGPDTSLSKTIRGFDRLEIIPLREAWSPPRFAKALPGTLKQLVWQIRRADYLHFAIGGLWGDWGAVACEVAYHLRLPYAVWTDRVESEVARYANQNRKGLKRVYWSFNIRMMAAVERRVIRQSAIGLFNGLDTFEAYSKFCDNPHALYNISTTDESFIALEELKRRLDRHGPLRIIYAGRAHREKGVFDWIDALSQLSIDFEATWLGDGPELQQARSIADNVGLSSRVKFPGAVSHSEAQAALKQSDVFLFCHKTRESPRCLIEALHSGLPLVGYDTAYPRSLIEGVAGILTPMDESGLVAESLTKLVADKALLRSLSDSAASQGRKFSAEKLFKERSDLMKTTPAESGERKGKPELNTEPPRRF